MNTPNHLFLLVIMLALLFSCSVNVVDDRAEYVFSIHDINKNGSLSREEYFHFVSHIEDQRKSGTGKTQQFSSTLRFEEIDNNYDGIITEDEMIMALNKRLQKHRRYRYRGGQG